MACRRKVRTTFHILVIMKNQIYPFYFSLTILLCLCNISFGQNKRYSFDEITLNCKCPDFEWASLGRELKPIRDFDNDLEIRLDIHAKWDDRSTTVISRKNGRYEGFFYHKRKNNSMIIDNDSLIKYKGKWEMYNFKKFSLSRYNLDSITKLLLSYQIMKLPNQNEVYKKPFITPYTISYKIDGQIRSFRFGPPKEPIQEYPNERIFKQYEAILQLFSEMTNPMYHQIWNDIRLQSEKAKRDTVFLRKPTAKGNSIYLDKDEDESPYFDVVKNLDYTIADNEYEKSFAKLIKRNGKNKNTIRLGDLPRNWIQLHRYKKENYNYASAKKKELKISLNDSTVITYDSSVKLQLIKDIQQIDRNNYKITTTDKNGKTSPFYIRYLHKSRGLAVFKDYYGKGLNLLMVNIEDADRFPLITNHSPTGNDPEYQFEKPDFKKLLNPPQFYKLN
jgi:hypothetical protein